jgi:hypothetical protein
VFLPRRFIFAMGSESSARGWVAWAVALLVGLVIGARGLWAAGVRESPALNELALLVPALACGAVAWLFVWAAPRWIYLRLRGEGATARGLARAAAAALLAVVAAALVERWVQRAVDERMEVVVAAVERYRADRGYFPVDLRDVTPGYLREIPPAWPLGRGCGYVYVRTGEGVALRRSDLDDRGERGCAPEHGVRYRFHSRQWVTW